MTYEDAIELLRHDKARNFVKGELEEYWRAFDMAIEALEKQIPKKPNSIFCPICNFPSIIDGEYGDRYPYCFNCGQAIDWTEDKE